MEPTKLERAATLLHDLRQKTEGLLVACLTLDALTVYQSPTKAIELGGWWQQLCELEVKMEEGFNSITEYGEIIRDLAWELHEKGYLPSTPQYGYDLREGDDMEPLDENSDDFQYDSDLLEDAMCEIRSGVLKAIYVGVSNAKA